MHDNVTVTFLFVLYSFDNEIFIQLRKHNCFLTYKFYEIQITWFKFSNQTIPCRMKGTIHYCLEESIIKMYGEDAWGQIMTSLGNAPDYSYGTHIRDDIDEVQSIELFILSSNILKVPLSEIFDVFGEHWCVDYSPRVYGVFYRGMKTTRDAITKLDHVHEVVTGHIKGAFPPRFKYTWLNDNKLQVEYISDRNLIDLFISLIKGLDKKFNNKTIIEKLDEHMLNLTFQAN